MALVDRPLQPSAGTDGRVSSSVPPSRSNQSKPSPSRERRTTSSRSGGQSGDGSEFPRYFMQLGHDVKRSHAYDLIQELQLMICNKDTGFKGNATRARAMVLLKEVQDVLTGLENKLDAQTFDLGVAAVERSELRKELRDEKAKEVAPFHTVDFRSTEVRDLPHKLRTLFEDNQLLREQVRQLQYTVRSAEAKLEAAQRKNGAVELELAGLSVALREAGSNPDQAQEMRRLRENARSAEARSLQLEGQVVSLLQQMEADRLAAAQQARAAAARQAALEDKLRAALGVASSARVVGVGVGAGGGGRKSSARSGVMEGWDVGAADEDAGGRGSVAAAGGRPQEYGIPDYLLDADAAFSGSGHGGADGGGGGVAGGIGSRPSVKHFRQSAYSTASSVAGGGAGSRGRLSSGRDHSPPSPPRSPVGRSLSHSPGSSIPALYPLFNAKPRATHAFSAESPTWNTSAQSLGGGGSSYTGGGGGGFGDSGHGTPPPAPSLHLPPAPHMQRDHTGTGSPRGSGSGIGGGGGAAAAVGSPSRPHSGSPHAPGPGHGHGLDALHDGRGGRSPSAVSAASREGTGPGEQVRAINSSAVVTSRTLLPSVSGSSTGGSIGGGGVAGGSARSSGLGILSLRVSMGTGSGSTGSGGGGVRRSSGYGSGTGGLQALSPEPADERGGGRAERRESARQGLSGRGTGTGTGAGAGAGAGAGEEGGGEAAGAADQESAAPLEASGLEAPALGTQR